MAEFLDRKKLLDWVPALIESATRELIIISPYIQISDRIFQLLREAEERGVEITLIYKEGELNEKERIRFNEIGNLNLLHHPNLHSKCIYNEKYLLVTSMNLYEFSHRHNREMGILFRRTDEEASAWNHYKTGRDHESIFQDAIVEIQSIINSADFDKESTETRSVGFEMAIIKSAKDLAEEKCALFNRFSKNKKFIPFRDGEEWLCRCDNFIDEVDLIIEKHRISLALNFQPARTAEIFRRLDTSSRNRAGDYREVGCFRMFWTHHKASPTLYPLLSHKTWSCEVNSIAYLEGYFSGLNDFFRILKPEIARTKN